MKLLACKIYARFSSADLLIETIVIAEIICGLCESPLDGAERFRIERA
jgi:hypothetical protein